MANHRREISSVFLPPSFLSTQRRPYRPITSLYRIAMSVFPITSLSRVHFVVAARCCVEGLSPPLSVFHSITSLAVARIAHVRAILYERRVSRSVKRLIYPRDGYTHLTDRGKKKRGSEKRDRVDVRRASRSMRANKIPRKYPAIFFRWTLLSLLVRYVLIFSKTRHTEVKYMRAKFMFFPIFIKSAILFHIFRDT